MKSDEIEPDEIDSNDDKALDIDHPETDPNSDKDDDENENENEI